MGELYGNRARTSKRLPADWRNRLPDPARYFALHVEKLGHPNGSGNASARCPFHKDAHASLSIRTDGRGLWRCHAGCGGGDLVGFHQRLTGLSFADAVRDLIGMRGAR